MKNTIKVSLIIALATFLGACSSKQIPKQSPCACYDLIIKVG